MKVAFFVHIFQTLNTNCFFSPEFFIVTDVIKTNLFQ